MTNYSIIARRPRANFPPDFDDIEVRETDSLVHAQDLAVDFIGQCLFEYYGEPGADWTGRKPSSEALIDAAYAIGKEGGTLPPLPDGTVIKIIPAPT